MIAVYPLLAPTALMIPTSAGALDVLESRISQAAPKNAGAFTLGAPVRCPVRLDYMLVPVQYYSVHSRDERYARQSALIRNAPLLLTAMVIG